MRMLTVATARSASAFAAWLPLSMVTACVVRIMAAVSSLRRRNSASSNGLVSQRLVKTKRSGPRAWAPRVRIISIVVGVKPARNGRAVQRARSPWRAARSR